MFKYEKKGAGKYVLQHILVFFAWENLVNSKKSAIFAIPNEGDCVRWNV